MNGLRARLGRPTSRGVVVWASVFALACGLFAASFGTWLAWLGSRPLDHRELAAAVEQLYPGEQVRDLDREDPSAVFLIYGSPLGSRSAGDLLLGDGGEYSFAGLGASFDRLPAGTQPATLAQLRERLRAAGWDLGEPVYSHSYDCVAESPQCDPASIPSDITLSARRGDNLLEVHLNGAGTTPVMDLAMTRATPWTAYPAGLLAFLLGTAGGWLLFGSVSRRAGLGPLTKVAFGLAMFLWWAPILLAAPQLLAHHLREPHFRWHPLWEWLGQPTMSLPFLVGWLVLMLAGGLTALPFRRPVRQAVA
ncbi:hypothetical protein [Actinoplanes regularis]|uniref:Uncharacterized protein n=1 Tax=Actinoplanes regularis TaxID=52697 RepID=A0A239K4E2_9ACTN|nr:hypothetical protein [Actinoplanes regularis]GIE92390.1 hypothetical protein Are01nite_88700 [Actinoplanes regularis]SNT12552.1 hypothetical protein SAMN06264365_1427 [Actinoplanes regularis]